MHRLVLAGLGLACCLAAARAADLASCIGCTGPTPALACGPACTATWEEKKSSQPEYSLRCEYACARARDSWHAPPPECRCSPPGGAVYVKKRLYKVDGEPEVERVPKYEVMAARRQQCVRAAMEGDPVCRDAHVPSLSLWERVGVRVQEIWAPPKAPSPGLRPASPRGRGDVRRPSANPTSRFEQYRLEGRSERPGETARATPTHRNAPDPSCFA